MRELTVKEILHACGGRLPAADSSVAAELSRKTVSRVETDSRKILPGEDHRKLLFLALKGERFDGNAFAAEAAARGAGAVLCALPEEEAARLAEQYGRDCAVILAEKGDTLDALGRIAGYYRSLFRIPVIAVTGSVGKTSTKEMTAAVLSEAFCVLKTEANFNNEIGVPRTLLSLEPSHGAAVVEMGMRGRGQIRRLCDMARPAVGIVTNIGDAHIELLGSRENILRAKLEIASFMEPGGVLCLNGDDPLLGNRSLVQAVLSEERDGRPGPALVFFGTGAHCDYRATEIRHDENGSRFLLCTPGGSCEAAISVPGRHHIYNALAAAAVAGVCGMTPQAVSAGIASFGSAAQLRQKIEKARAGVTVIDDTYNAGPESVRASLDVLGEIGTGTGNRAVAVLGDMLELGAVSERAHEDAGRYAAERGVSCLLTAGPMAARIARGFLAAGGREAACFPDSGAAADAVMRFLQKGDIILVKGSHAMKMETVVQRILAAEKLPDRKG